MAGEARSAKCRRRNVEANRAFAMDHSIAFARKRLSVPSHAVNRIRGSRSTACQSCRRTPPLAPSSNHRLHARSRASVFTSLPNRVIARVGNAVDVISVLAFCWRFGTEKAKTPGRVCFCSRNAAKRTDTETELQNPYRLACAAPNTLPYIIPKARRPNSETRTRTRVRVQVSVDASCV